MLQRHTTLRQIAFVILSLPAVIHAAPATVVDTLLLSLDTARELVLERNTSLQRQSNTAALSQVAADEAGAALYPDLRLSATTSQRSDLDGEHSRSLNLQASSSLNLFNGFGDVAAIESARLTAAASAGDLQRTREFLLYEVTAEYLEAVLALELVAIEEERLDSEQRQLDRIESLHGVGERPWADVLQQRAAVARAELELLEARRAYEVDLLSLKELLALDPDTRTELASATIPAGIPVDDDLQSLLKEALQEREDVQAQSARIRAAEESLRAAGSGHWPSLDLTVGVGSSYNSQLAALDFGDQLFDANPDATVGLSLSIPLFDRERTDAAVSRARIQLANEQLVYDALVRDVGLQLEQALLNHRIAAAQLEVSRTQLQYAREALAATEARYFEGLATLVEVSQSRAQYVEAAGNQATAETTLTLRQLEIELQRGGNLL